MVKVPRLRHTPKGVVQVAIVTKGYDRRRECEVSVPIVRFNTKGCGQRPIIEVPDLIMCFKYKRCGQDPKQCSKFKSVVQDKTMCPNSVLQEKSTQTQ